MHSEKFYLYKYKPLKDIEELKHLENFLQQKIWIPTAEDMNDPFEFVHKFEIDPAETLQDSKTLNGQLSFYNQLSKEKQLSEKQFSAMLQDSDSMTFQKIKEHYKRIGLFCLTTDYSNIPMWAYYGNQHKGFCLIFELDFSTVFNSIALSSQYRAQYQQNIVNGKEILSFSANHDENLKFAFGKVMYFDTPQIIKYHDTLKFLENSSSYDNMKFWFLRIFGVKYAQWSHESEYRLISTTNSKDSDQKCLNLSYYAPFLKVCGVIMGKYFPVKEEIKVLCSKYEIDLYQSDTSDHEYSINLEKIMDFKKTTTSLLTS